MFKLIDNNENGFINKKEFLDFFFLIIDDKNFAIDLVDRIFEKIEGNKIDKKLFFSILNEKVKELIYHEMTIIFN